MLLERSCAPGTYGHYWAEQIAKWLSAKQAIDPEAIARWQTDLERQSAAGDYLFSINRYVCLSRP